MCSQVSRPRALWFPLKILALGRSLDSWKSRQGNLQFSKIDSKMSGKGAGEATADKNMSRLSLVGRALELVHCRPMRKYGCCRSRTCRLRPRLCHSIGPKIDCEMSHLSVDFENHMFTNFKKSVSALFRRRNSNAKFTSETEGWYKHVIKSQNCVTIPSVFKHWGTGLAWASISVRLVEKWTKRTKMEVSQSLTMRIRLT